MNRATLVYVSMAVAAIAGLWAILTVGGRLVPPRDFAGVWSLTPTQPGSADLGKSVLIEQSGRFFQLQFSNGQLLKLTMTAVAQPVVPLSGGKTSATIAPDAAVDSATITLTGQTSGTWSARRETRTFAGEKNGPPKKGGT